MEANLHKLGARYVELTKRAAIVSGIVGILGLTCWLWNVVVKPTESRMGDHGLGMAVAGFFALFMSLIYSLERLYVLRKRPSMVNLAFTLSSRMNSATLLLIVGVLVGDKLLDRSYIPVSGCILALGAFEFLRYISFKAELLNLEGRSRPAGYEPPHIPLAN